jgi:hypothetical protein
MDIICDCSNHGYRVVPTHIPHNVTILDLSGNRLTFIVKNTICYHYNDVDTETRNIFPHCIFQKITMCKNRLTQAHSYR